MCGIGCHTSHDTDERGRESPLEVKVIHAWKIGGVWEMGWETHIEVPSSSLKINVAYEGTFTTNNSTKKETENFAKVNGPASYFTMGVNLKDIALMKMSDIRDGLWYFERSKTNNSSLGKPLLPECLEIIQKYAEPDNKYVFDFILGDKYDRDDKTISKRKTDVISNLRDMYVKISKKLGFDGHFSFYSARYTSATVSANKGADLRAVQANLTHASITTTEIYSQFRNEDAMRESLELLRVGGSNSIKTNN